MRMFVAALAGVGVVLAAMPSLTGAQTSSKKQSAEKRLVGSLNGSMGQAGGAGGAYVLDLSTGQPLYSNKAGVMRLPASVEKLYTTSTALLLYGPNATLTTSIYGKGQLQGNGQWSGTLYLRGGGDPTFGSSSYDHYAYGSGATIQRLVTNFVRESGIKSLRGRIVGDESYFDSLRGTIATDEQFSPYLEGSLSALAFDRGLTDDGYDYIIHPAVYAAQQLESALHSDGVKVSSSTPISAGKTPGGAQLLATVHSPRIATLIRWTNSPSDDFFAEMLAKGIGARFGRGGTTPDGAAVIRNEMSSQFGITPRLDDGSGLSRDDATSPKQVVSLLRQMDDNPDFVGSLAVMGETGTLQDVDLGTFAAGRCRGKTGTLHDVADLAGYCLARDGHMLAFAFLINSIDDKYYVHDVDANMALAVANYNG
jgi:D-alanyl-D-alanine carboxypeptidase/D-alanyl-D-alanine-endopeptidase (penicillin-binding protein 4)